ncbi:THO complex subunit 1-like [Miscanthus floridulus]|uniref:THO complex subunit 1-like n=1 Tax=Miscanthus floridulus TaxID=154761 RepID=UPI003458C359
MAAGRPHEQIRPGDTSTAHPCTGVLHLSPRVPRPQDIVLYLCERGHVEGGMVFQRLEDLTEMSTIKDCKDIFRYIESQQDVLGKQELFGRGKLVMLRTCNQLLRRLSKVETIRFTESLSCTFSRIVAVCLVLSCVTCIERRLVFTILFIYLCAVS